MSPTAAQVDPASGSDGGPDAALVLAARAGDAGALAALYRKYAPVVHGVLLSRMPQPDADDLTQEVFVSAMRELGVLRDPGAVGGWLIAAARNLAATRARDRARRPALALADDVPAPRTRDGATRDDVLRAIRELPDAYAETLALRLVEGLTGPQIAEATGMTHGSVRVNLHRGMELLRERLGAINAEERA